MANYSKHVSMRQTPQTQPVIGRSDQIPNGAGGYVFAVDEWTRLDRFLILGCEGGTYYAAEPKLTIDNAKAILRLIDQDGERVVARTVEISDAGRAPKNDPAIFVLALCASATNPKTRQAALAALRKVCRIGTHLFTFAESVQSQRGWGRGLRRAIGNWYDRPTDALAYQLVKYQQRNGWSHRDLLRLAHPATTDATKHALFDWVCGRQPIGDLPGIIQAFIALKANPSAGAAIDAIGKYNLPREAIPTELLNDPDVWRAMLPNMPLTAMIRNLGKMTAIDVLKPLGREVENVLTALSDAAQLKLARIHPIAILIAQKIYAQGRGEKGSLVWAPIPRVIDALDKAFYAAFANVEPTGKRWLLALDVSGSMAMGMVAGTPLTPREGAAAMALVIAKTEPNYHIIAYQDRITPLNISANMRLDDVIQRTSGLSFGGTDCAQPWVYANNKGLDVDAIVSITDAETWAGPGHVFQEAEKYRRQRNIATRSIVIGMTATQCTVNDPNDALALDVAGFDAAVPSLIGDFVRG